MTGTKLTQRIIERADGSFELVLEGPTAHKRNNPLGWSLQPGVSADMLGWLPCFLDPEDPRSAREQLNTNYAHGGGWQPQEGFSMTSPRTFLRYEGDPSFRLLASFKLRDETVLLFETALVAIVQPDGSFECCRMD